MPVFDLTPRAAVSSLRGELAVVVPIYNESATIGTVVGEWQAVFDLLGIAYTFVLVNDGSRDDTMTVLRQLETAHADRFVVLDKPNAGHGRSCRLGYDLAAMSEVEWVLQIDSDGQCDPAYFEAFWARRQDADCVFGVRKDRDDGFLRKVTSQICRAGSSLLSGMDLRDPNVPYRLMRTRTLRAALARIPTDFNIHNVALTYTLRRDKAVRWAYVPIHFRDRQGGSNSINVLRVTQWGVEMLLELRRLK